MKINGFSYDSKTGNFECFDEKANRYLIQYEYYYGGLYVFIEYKGRKRYLTQQELIVLKNTVVYLRKKFHLFS